MMHPSLISSLLETAMTSTVSHVLASAEDHQGAQSHQQPHHLLQDAAHQVCLSPTKFACDPNFGLNLRCCNACKDLFVYAVDARLEHVGLIGVTLEVVPQLVCKHRIPSSRRHCTPPHIHFVTVGARRDDLAKRPQQIFKSICGARGALGSQNFQYCTENAGYPNRTLSNFEVNDSLVTPPPAS